jgi:cytochrome c-type biogenesis protein CcmE
MTRKQRRLAVVVVGLALLGGATAMVLAAFSDNLVFFYSPSELAEKGLRPNQRVRIGGLVETQSLQRQDGRRVSFRVTDGKADIAVSFDGMLPDLFREGQGVVAEGRVGPDGVFVASNVLAKHDEKYMPREVADALKKSGRWQEGGDTGALAGPPPAKLQ